MDLRHAGKHDSDSVSGEPEAARKAMQIALLSGAHTSQTCTFEPGNTYIAIHTTWVLLLLVCGAFPSEIETSNSKNRPEEHPRP